MNKLRLIIKNVVKSLTARKSKTFLSEIPYKIEVKTIHLSNGSKFVDIPYSVIYYKKWIDVKYYEVPDKIMDYIYK